MTDIGDMTDDELEHMELDLFAFLDARVAEDEEYGQIWRELDEANQPVLGASYVILPVCLQAERVLAECKAKREIIEEARLRTVRLTVFLPQLLDWDTLCALARVYRGHPDFQEVWDVDAAS